MVQADGREPRNALRKHAKAEAATLAKLVRCFCQGLSVGGAAKACGLTEKSVRGYYIALRHRLLKQQFNKWHHGWAALVRVKDETTQETTREAYFATLAGCYFASTCQRNHAAGNRKQRLCRKCPMPDRFSAPERVEEALGLIDTVRYFYDRIGIGVEHGWEPAPLFRERLIHTAVIASVGENTARDAAGRLDPNDKSFLSFRTLFDTLLGDLLEEPL